ncbi:MAG: chromate transporter [Clostridiaceae bacterium]|jgi:chromate transporter|nr:chromate transporter [Clostridiaceae bacterium]
MKELWELFKIFFRIGAFTFGGGYSMLPILQKEVVENRKWCTYEEIIDYYAIGQSTPGIIAVNTSIFIGYKIRGVIGGIFAALGIAMPSLIIITIIAAFFGRFQDNETVKNAFGGIRAVVPALILSAVLKMWNKSVVDKLTIFIFIIAFLVSILTDITPILIVTVSAAIGIFANYLLKGEKAK